VQIESALKEGDKVVPNLSSQIASGLTVDAHELDVRLAGSALFGPHRFGVCLLCATTGRSLDVSF
jgi:hypothetical protein